MVGILVRVLLVLAASTALYGCGQASSPVERQEKEHGAEQRDQRASQGPQETTQQVAGNMPVAGVVGENVQTDSFDFRVLDYFVTDHYYYLTDPSFGDVQDAIPQAGKFVVVNYSVTNTSPQTISPNPIGQLHAGVGDKVEVYNETEEIIPPHHPLAGLPMDDIPPRQLVVSQLIFDVPTDVEPEMVAVSNQPTIDTVLDVGVVDLTDEDPQGPRPEEIFALQLEYYNMTAHGRAYVLFAQESKARVSEEAFVSKNKQNDQRDPGTFTKYSFPSVTIEGDHATIQAVRSFSYEKAGEGQERITQEAILEEEGWRIVMRDNQYEYYGA